MANNKAIFFDRDGTIIRDEHYLSDPAKVVLLPKAAQAISLLLEQGYLLFLLTNQSGVGRGFYSMEVVHRCNERMIELLGLGRPVFSAICIAPERPDEPAIYRKPSPRFINECVVNYDLERARSWMVGDKPADLETGVNAGINSALVGPGGPTPMKAGIHRYSGIYDFAVAITSAAS